MLEIREISADIVKLQSEGWSDPIVQYYVTFERIEGKRRVTDILGAAYATRSEADTALKLAKPLYPSARIGMFVRVSTRP